MREQIMKVLICGPPNSGSTRILRVVINMARSKNLKVNVIKEYKHEASFLNDYDLNVYECVNFWEVYPSIRFFDVVIFCIRDIRYVCSTIIETAEYLQNVQCWNIFASLTVKYEMYGPEQVMNISNLLQIPITYDDLIDLLEKVRIIRIKPYNLNTNNMKDQISKWPLVHDYLTRFEYIKGKGESIIHHSASF